MARIITVADLREHVETDLPEAALQRLIDEADELVVTSYGAHGPTTQTDDLRSDVGMTLLFPERPIESVTTVTEFTSATTSEVLNPTDYDVGLGGRSLERLTTGPNPSLSWGYKTLVAYVIATTENPRRRGVVIDLVRLAAVHTGLRSERAGDYSATSVDYETERGKILGRLGGMSLSV